MVVGSIPTRPTISLKIRSFLTPPSRNAKAPHIGLNFPHSISSSCSFSPLAVEQANPVWLQLRHEASSLKRLAKHYGCPVELSLEILGGKWKPVILSRLKERPYRYSELRRLIPNLSTKMLTQRLRDLELQGLVERQGISGRPHSLYGLTARATSLKPVLQALYDWGQRTATELKVEIRSPASTHR